MTSNKAPEVENSQQAKGPFAPILIAEDSEEYCDLLRQAFERAQIANPLLFAKNGEEVIALLKGMGSNLKTAPYLPRILLLDEEMPRMGGFDVVEWLRRHPPLRRLPIIVFTESEHRQEINKAYDLGVNSVVRKRRDLAELTEILKNLHTYWLCWNETPDLAANSLGQ